jgi:hypothetical protein
MRVEERQSKIKAYGSAYQTLAEGLKRFPKEMRQVNHSRNHHPYHRQCSQQLYPLSAIDR